MRILADENIELVMVDWLDRVGQEVEWITSVSPGVDDRSVLARSVRDDRVLLTYDNDFGDLVFRQRAATSGVILLRLSAPRVGDRLTALQRQWSEIESCAAGAFLVVHDTRVRVRRISGGNRMTDFLPGEDEP